MNPPAYPTPQPPNEFAQAQARRRPRRHSLRRIIIATVVALLTLTIGAAVADRVLYKIELANRATCAAHMRAIGQAILLYASDHGGALPSDLDLISKSQSPEILHCPSTKTAASPYAYAGSGLTLPQLQGKSAAITVLLYEPLADHGDEGINVLWADGHITWEGADWGKQVIESIKGGQNPPQIRGLTTPLETPTMTTKDLNHRAEEVLKNAAGGPALPEPPK